jgi:hypothetical protein
MTSRFEPMSPLDKRCILALKPVRGLSDQAARISDGLLSDLQRDRPISIRQRHALYAICWRFRKQLPIDLQVKVAIAAADAHMMVLLTDEPGRPKVRGHRGVEVASLPVRNPLDDLFTTARTPG